MIVQRICFALRISGLQDLKNCIKCMHSSVTLSYDILIKHKHFVRFNITCNHDQTINLKKISKFIYRSNYTTSSASSLGLKYIQNENDRAHAVFEANEAYSTILAPSRIQFKGALLDFQANAEFDAYLCNDWIDKTVSDNISAFEAISYFIKSKNLDIEISNEKFDKITQGILSHSDEFSFEHICYLLHYLSVWKTPLSPKAHNFKEVWNALDKACCDNAHQWNTIQLLRMCDYWYKLHLGGICKFNWHAINKLSRKTSRLTPQQLVMTLFLINLRRTFPPAVDAIDYQVSLEQHADKLSLEELGVCAMGFFKTQKKVRTPRILEVMIAKATAECETVDPIILTAILKVCRSSLPITLVDQLYSLQSALQPRVSELPLVCCLHVALSGTNVHMLHKGMISEVLQRMLSHLSACRMKELERIAFVMSMFNWPTTVPGLSGCNVYELLAAEVSRPERESEILKYPRCLTNFLFFLSTMGTYPLSLIDKCLSKALIGSVYSLSTQTVGSELLSLDVAVEIEHTEYKGNALDEKTRRFLSKVVSMHPKKWEDLDFSTGATGDKQLKELIATALDYVKDPNKLFVGHVLPNYFRPDIVLRLNEDNPTELMPIPDSIKEYELGDIRRPRDSGKFVCLVPASWNLLIRGTNQPIGSVSQKLRLLRAIGYIPSLIPWHEWQAAPNKHDYIKRKILEGVAVETVLMSHRQK